jgi:uncharacterized protein (DUF1330 family)
MECVVVNIERVTDPKKYRRYVAVMRKYIFRFGGELLAVGDAEARGVWGTSRTLVLGFPSCATLKAWYSSREWKRLASLRTDSTHALMSFINRTGKPKARAAKAA